MNRFVRLVMLLAITLAAGIGSGAPAFGQEDGGRGDLRFVVVSHGQASDPFWSVVQNGVNQAAEDMGVQVEYQAPPSTW
jgi:simple sugar transport system substrate-binding protein